MVTMCMFYFFEKYEVVPHDHQETEQNNNNKKNLQVKTEEILNKSSNPQLTIMEAKIFSH